jgi:UDP-glucose 4-epimerase
MEIALLNLAKVEPLQVNFIRPFNIIGPYQKGEVGFVVPRFVAAALKDEPITVFGDGEQKRTFTHVRDIVRPMVDLMETDYRSNIYNIGNPANLCSIKNLAKRIVQLAGSKSEIRLTDPKEIYGPLYEEAWNKIADVSRATKHLNWKPEYSLDEILVEYIDFARGKVDFMNPHFS